MAAQSVIMDLSVVIPTYNETENLAALLAQVFTVLKDNEINGEVIIVDDDSPDRTWELAQGLTKRYKDLRVIRRQSEKGLATAVLTGFAAASSSKLLVMDADLSHPPWLISKLYKALEEADISVASRNVKGGGVRNWPASRKAISWGATQIARLLTDVKDPMSGYFALHKEVLEGADLDPKGYKILLEILVKGRYQKVQEIPFVFEDRRVGTSKMSSGIITKYVSHSWSLLKVAKNTRAQLVRFLMIGGLGILVNLAVLWALVNFGSMNYLPAAVLSFIAAVTFNFAGNRLFAFRAQGSLSGQYAKFFTVSVGSLVINLGALFMLVDIGHLWYMAGQVIAILVATSCNFAGNKAWTFRATAAVRPKDVRTGALRAIVLGNVHGYDTGRAR
jgi:dolichol-phosphate mannosyltransferase